MIGSLLYRDKRAEEMWEELYVRSNTGIGRAPAEVLAGHGFGVYAGARKQEDLAALGSLPQVVPVRLAAGVAGVGEAVVIVVAGVSQPVQRAGQVLAHRVEEGLHSAIPEGRAHQHRDDLAGDGGPANGQVDQGDLRFAVLEQDPFEVDPMAIRDIPVWCTALGGKLQPA